MNRAKKLLTLIILLTPSIALHAEVSVTSIPIVKPINVVWTLVAAFLVIFMQAGFAMVELGFTRAKNAGNIIMKNLLDFTVGSIAFFIIGFSLMFGDTISDFIGDSSLFLANAAPGNPDDGLWMFAFRLFQ